MREASSNGSEASPLPVVVAPSIKEVPPAIKTTAAWLSTLKLIGSCVVGAIVLVATITVGVKSYADNLARHTDLEALRLSSTTALQAHATTPEHPGTQIKLADHDARLRVLEAMAKNNGEEHAWLRQATTRLLESRRLPIPDPPKIETIQ